MVYEWRFDVMSDGSYKWWRLVVSGHAKPCPDERVITKSDDNDE